jgi:hypothetical protein
MKKGEYVVNGCFILFIFSLLLSDSDTISDFIGCGSIGRVYKAFKGGKEFAVKKVPYQTEHEIESADKEEEMLKLFKGLCPYLMGIEDSFEDVFFFIPFFF